MKKEAIALVTESREPQPIKTKSFRTTIRKEFKKKKRESQSRKLLLQNRKTNQRLHFRSENVS